MMVCACSQSLKLWLEDELWLLGVGVPDLEFIF